MITSLPTKLNRKIMFLFKYIPSYDKNLRADVLELLKKEETITNGGMSLMQDGHLFPNIPCNTEDSFHG